MTLRVGKLVYGLLKLLPCLLAFLLASSCSSDQYSDELKGGETLVTLTVATGNGTTSDGTGSVTTGVASSTDKDNYIKDLLVYIFDKNGNVIGTDQGNYTVTDASTITVKVKTRPAEGCTVYAIANAATLTEKAFPFAGVSTLDEFKSQVMSFSTDVDGNGLVAQEKSSVYLQRIKRQQGYKIERGIARAEIVDGNAEAGRLQLRHDLDKLIDVLGKQACGYF